MKTPAVSVILCTFNRARLLVRAVESVLRQSFTEWELIIVDDGSTDETPSVIEGYIKKDERIKALCHENMGLAASRNRGIKEASGTYFALIDDDDEYGKDHLEKRFKYMADHADADILWGGLVPRGPENRRFVHDMEKPGKKIHLSECFVSGTLFGKISVFNDLGGFNMLDYAEDWDLMKRAREKFNIHRVCFPTYFYSLEAPNRLSDLYAEGREEAIRAYREKRK